MRKSDEEPDDKGNGEMDTQESIASEMMKEMDTLESTEPDARSNSPLSSHIASYILPVLTNDFFSRTSQMLIPVQELHEETNVTAGSDI